MTVHFLVLDTSSKTQETRAVVGVHNGRAVVLDGDKAWADAVLESAIVLDETRERLTPAAGDRWLAALAEMFSGSYVRAELKE